MKNEHNKIFLIFTTILLLVSIIGFLLIRLIKTLESQHSESGKIILDEEFYEDLGNGWHRIDASAFSLEAPINFRLVVGQGIDSYVGEITDGFIRINFDYGWYSYSFNYEDFSKHLVAIDTINGKLASLIKPRIMGDGIFGAYFHKAYQDNRLSISSTDRIDEATFLRILKSVKFKDSNQTNSKSSVPHFSDKPLIPIILYNSNCSTCHAKGTKKMLGPGFRTIEPESFVSWFFDKNQNGSPIELQAKSMGPKWHQETFKNLDSTQIHSLSQFSKESDRIW